MYVVFYLESRLGQAVKGSPELRAMLEVDPTGLGSRVYALQRRVVFDAEVPRVRSYPELASVGWDTFGSDGID